MIDAKKIATCVVNEIIKEENSLRKKVVVYGGRFQPFHQGHFKVYQHLVDKFGRENVYIGTSNKVSPPRSPFSFKEKKEIMTRLFNLPSNKIVQVKNVYTPKEILKNFDKDETAFITVVGKKDRNRLGGSYFEEYKETKPLENYGDAGYVYVAPELKSVSGTEVRKRLGDPSKSLELKKTEFKRLYDKYDSKIFDLITDKLTEAVILEWIIEKNGNIFETYNKLAKEIEEAQLTFSPGFTFIAKHSKEGLKKGIKYIVDDIKGRIGDLTVIVRRFGKDDDIPVHVRSHAEFYRDIIGEVLKEGGAYGHMNHPFDLEIDLTFGDLKNIVNLALEGELKLAREKTDGQALAVSWRDDRGGLIAARNKSHLKNSGKDAMDLDDLKSKFSGRGKLTDAYVYAMKDLEKAISSLSDRQREKIFQNGSSFMNIEVIFTENPNVIPYGQNLLVFHGTMQYDEDGNPIGENQSAARTLAGMIKQVNQDVQDTYELKGPPIQKLPNSEDLSKKKPKYLKAIKKLQSEFNLKDNDGVSEYHQAWWEDWVEKNAPKTLDNRTKMHLVKRWAFLDRSNRLNGKTIPDDEVLQWAKKVDKQKHDKIASKNIQKFENIFLSLGAEVLSYMSSVLTVNPDDAVQQIKDRLDKTIKDVQKSGDEQKINKLKKELERLEQAGGTEKLVPNEGIVFTYKGNTLKLTGTFASLNQILGLMYGK